MWICSRCRRSVDDRHEACPACGAVSFRVEASDEPTPKHLTPADPEIDQEASTQFDLDAVTEIGVVECYIGVESAAAEEVARRLAAIGIAAAIDRVAAAEKTAESPLHRVRVPIADVGRALAIIDETQRRRPVRP